MLMTEELTATENSGDKPAHKALLRVDAPIREVPERHRERILRHDIVIIGGLLMRLVAFAMTAAVECETMEALARPLPALRLHGQRCADHALREQPGFLAR